MRDLGDYFRNEKGASAAEFALVLMPFLIIFIGFLNLCAVMYFNATMQNAVEDSARWAAVQTVATGAAPSCSTVLAHFNARYVGPTVNCTSLTYDPSATEANCSSGSGSALYHRVAAQATYNLNAIVTSIPVLVHASACFPRA